MTYELGSGVYTSLWHQSYDPGEIGLWGQSISNGV